MLAVLNMPNKIKHFSWKACNGILATKDSLFRRKITANNIYEACGMHVETIMHMLCFCSRGTEVWSSSKLTFPFINKIHGASWKHSIDCGIDGRHSLGCWRNGSLFVGVFGRA